MGILIIGLRPTALETIRPGAGGLLRRESLLPFAFLAAQGGCEPQLTAHAAGNMNLGTDRDYLIRVVSQILPYIGYPRSLNAISCVNKAAEERK